MNIDLHSHAVSREIIEVFRKEPFRYGQSVKELPDGKQAMVAPSGLTFVLEPGYYDGKARLVDMDAREVDIEYVTPAPNTFFYNLSKEDTEYSFRVVNDGIAAMCQDAPDRLIACGTLPVHDVEASCRELERIVELYHMPMVLLNTSVNGHFYDEPQYLELFELCEKRNVMIQFHPQHDNTSYGLGGYYLTNLLGFPIDTTISATRLILSGVLDKFPRLNCLFVHAGGFIPYQKGRVQHGYEMRQEPRANLTVEDASKLYDRLYFDTITHNTASLEFLIKTHGADHVVLGSDYPFDMGDFRPASTVLDIPSLSEADKRLILSGNAETIMGKR